MKSSTRIRRYKDYKQFIEEEFPNYGDNEYPVLDDEEDDILSRIK